MTAVINPIAPITLAETDNWVDVLDRAFRRHSIATVLGPSGSGKSWLLNYWAREASKIVRPEQVVAVRLRPTVGRALPMTCILFSRLRYKLVRLAEPGYRIGQESEREEPILYTERHLASLFNIVLTLLGKLPVGAIVIDNAHLLDERSIEWLLDLRMESDPHYENKPRRALIFAAQAKPLELATCPLVKYLTDIEEASAAWCERIVLRHLKGQAFVNMLAKLFHDNLQAEFCDEPDADEINKELWELTKGNWWSLARLTGLFYEELEAQDERAPRIITRAVVDGVRKRLADLRV